MSDTRRVARARLRAAIHQGWLCYYCNKEMIGWREKPPGMSVRERQNRRVTAEHLTPRSKGGTHCLLNIVAACRECNMVRGNGERPPLRRGE